MKKLVMIACLLALFVQGTNAQQKLFKETEDQKKERMAWWTNDRFGMFIHWSIAAVREIDLSWPMMAGTQIGWDASYRKLTQDSIDRFIADGDYFAGHKCKKDNSCLSPVEYWEQARFFNPNSYNPEVWAKAAKAAGMTYMVFTARHHDGFAMWPSNYGNLSTLNYMGGRDLVRPYVEACRKYGLKVGLYYSGPDWYFNRTMQSFLYWRLAKDFKNVPSIDENLKPRTTTKTATDLQMHYDSVAVYLKGQITELLSNYGKIDMIWFDGGPDIPKGNPAWQKCISMDDIHRLQPGIIVSPRFFGYGDFKTFESDTDKPGETQKQWAELCTTVTGRSWGYTQTPLKPINNLIKDLILCRSRNANYLLNFGPDKNGTFSTEMNSYLSIFADWMKVNGSAIRGCIALPANETASIPATAHSNRRYLFVTDELKGKTITFDSPHQVKKVHFLASKIPVEFQIINNKQLVITLESNSSNLPLVIKVELK